MSGWWVFLAMCLVGLWNWIFLYSATPSRAKAFKKTVMFLASVAYFFALTQGMGPTPRYWYAHKDPYYILLGRSLEHGFIHGIRSLRRGEPYYVARRHCACSGEYVATHKYPHGFLHTCNRCGNVAMMERPHPLPLETYREYVTHMYPNRDWGYDD